MALLNASAYTVTPDNLIYDSTHPIDAEAVTVTLSVDADGTIKRGQIIDVSSGTYSIHAENGTPSAIVAEDTDYSASDTDAVVPVFVSGTFRLSEIIADPELTAANIETLREKGIFVK